MCFLLRSVDVTLRVAAIATKHKTKSLRISLLKHPHHGHSAESKHQLWLQDFVCQGIPKRDFYEFRTSVGETGETRGFSCHNSEWNLPTIQSYQRHGADIFTKAFSGCKGHWWFGLWGVTTVWIAGMGCRFLEDGSNIQ